MIKLEMVSKMLQDVMEINQISKAITKQKEVRSSKKLKKSYMEVQKIFYSLKLNSKTILNIQWRMESTLSATTQMQLDKFLKKLT